MKRASWFAAFFTLACAGVLLAEEAVSPAAQKPEPEGKSPPMKDPTQATGKLKDILTPQPKTGMTPAAPGAAVHKMPAMAIKARVLGKGKAAAVIEVDGQAYSVTPESTILAGGLTLKVIEVTAALVRIEVVQLKETVVLN
ncbi:MAG: hypothetical protein U0791_03635 [Gemmataceae bacterium]